MTSVTSGNERMFSSAPAGASYASLRSSTDAVGYSRPFRGLIGDLGAVEVKP